MQAKGTLEAVLENSWFVYILDPGTPTPHYNASVLSDMFLEYHLHYLYKCLVDFPGMKDAVALIKVWLHQRELDKVCSEKNQTTRNSHLSLISRLFTDRPYFL